MFISRTTREERVTIETALDSAFLKIDQAEQLIYDLIDAFLSDREQKTRSWNITCTPDTVMLPAYSSTSKAQHGQRLTWKTKKRIIVN